MPFYIYRGIGDFDSQQRNGSLGTSQTPPGSVTRVEETGRGRSDTGPSTFVVSYLNCQAGVLPVASAPLVCLGITGPRRGTVLLLSSQELTHILGCRGHRFSVHPPTTTQLPQLSQTLVTQGQGSLQWFQVSEPRLVYLLSASLERQTAIYLSSTNSSSEQEGHLDPRPQVTA